MREKVAIGHRKQVFSDVHISPLRHDLIIKTKLCFIVSDFDKIVSNIVIII